MFFTKSFVQPPPCPQLNVAKGEYVCLLYEISAFRLLFYSNFETGGGGGIFLYCDKLKSTYNRECKHVPVCFGKDCSYSIQVFEVL